MFEFEAVKSYKSIQNDFRWASFCWVTSPKRWGVWYCRQLEHCKCSLGWPIWQYSRGRLVCSMIYCLIFLSMLSKWAWERHTNYIGTCQVLYENRNLFYSKCTILNKKLVSLIVCCNTYYMPMSLVLSKLHSKGNMNQAYNSSKENSCRIQ